MEGIVTGDKRGRGRGHAAVNEKAAAKIGIHSELPPVLPFRSGLAFMYRSIGGLEGAIEAARIIAEHDDRYKALVFMYDETAESNRYKLKLEFLCESAGILQEQFVGDTIAAIFKRGSDIGKIMAGASHPRIVEATIEHAQKVNGFMDRKMLHDHIGFLPIPKGMTIINDNSKKTLVAGGQAQVQGGGAVEDTSKTSLPSFESDTLESTKAIRGDAGVGKVGQKRLPAPKPEQAVVVPGEILDAEPVD